MGFFLLNVANSLMLKDVDYSVVQKRIGDGSVQSLNMDDFDHYRFCTQSLYLSHRRDTDFGANGCAKNCRQSMYLTLDSKLVDRVTDSKSVRLSSDYIVVDYYSNIHVKKYCFCFFLI